MFRRVLNMLVINPAISKIWTIKLKFHIDHSVVPLV